MQKKEYKKILEHLLMKENNVFDQTKNNKGKLVFPESLINICKSLSIANIIDVSNSSRILDNGIKCLCEEVQVVGQAFTCKCKNEENLTVHKALTCAKPGDVLVIETCPDRDTAVLGEIMSLEASNRKLSGIIVDGPIRDVIQIRKMRMPVFYRSINFNKPNKDEFGSINTPIHCGGIEIFPGDLIVANDEGIVAIPRFMAEFVIAKAYELSKHEIEISNILKLEEKRLYELLNLQDHLNKLGIAEAHDSWEGLNGL